MSMPSLHYVIGDATDPIQRPALITHCCNSENRWGRGFVMALSARNTRPETAYHGWYKASKALVPGVVPFELGQVQFVPFGDQVFVANLIGQEGTKWVGKTPPIRYEAIRKGLTTAYAWCIERGFSMVMPRIGAVLGGGDWNTIERIIKDTMTVDTWVYTLENQKDRWPTEYT